MTAGLALFDTDIGRCGIAWGDHGLLGVQLPEATEARTLSRLAQKAPGAREVAMPDHVRQACDAMAELLRGAARDLTFVAVDMEQVPAFNRSVYDIARTIAPGETLTYGDIATRLGDKLLSRAVGKALGENPFPIVIPCHRVLAANGKTGGFSANGGVATKFRMLAIERARIASHASEDAPMLFDPGLSIAPQRRRR
ncbi:methylated-DNA--[protein]-cysteine S-methyltransferase [Bradyrhizobium sp. G127]|uniref:methylated-DNA--[protein]-cysteine S-methyltransferase n=1 Tax=Bradyrhizobium sp. G127 TaxID=2904800 RepID=UPI001F3688E2|nr:methylated-DNA--[protein]-cysteine S-methyltransferase [Bradyrhizobium sp. G127]MCF2525122.1 methylated-DNA--[protein]-cysteine S-methyltransferase [Bradyrhizobium sp. G127]